MNAESHWAAKRPIPFTNVSGETIPAFAVMAVTGVAYENGIALVECDKPGTAFSRQFVVNNLYDVPAGLRGGCFRAGDVRVLYDGGTPVAGEGWGPRPGQWSVSRGFPGLTVAGVVDAEHRVAKAFCEPAGEVLAKTTENVAAGATTQDYRIYAGPLGGEADAGFTTVPPARNRTGQSLAANEWIWLAWTNSGWELRALANRVYHVTYTGGGFGPGAGAIVLLPDGRLVAATNWSSDTTINTGDKLLVWQDFVNSAWYAVKSGGGGEALDWYEARLNGPLDSDSSTATINGAENVRTGDAAPGVSEARNPFELQGDDDDRVLVAATPGLGPPNYLLVQVVGRRSRRFKGFLGQTLDSEAPNVSVTLTGALDGGAYPASVTAQNHLDLSAQNGWFALVEEDLSESPKQYILYQVRQRRVEERNLLEDVYLEGLDLKKKRFTAYLFDPTEPEEFTIFEGTTCESGPGAAPLRRAQQQVAGGEPFAFESHNYLRPKLVS